jgi:hypothetical protein
MPVVDRFRTSTGPSMWPGIGRVSPVDDWLLTAHDDPEEDRLYCGADTLARVHIKAFKSILATAEARR